MILIGGFVIGNLEYSSPFRRLVTGSATETAAAALAPGSGVFL